MQEPTLQGVQEPLTSNADAAGALADEYTSQQKLMAAAGAVLIGGYIGYTLTQSYRGEAPQALWAHAAKAPSPATPARPLPHIAFVNLHDDVRPAAREGVRAWLSITDEVQVTFPTVMFVEEEEASSFAEISGDVRRAAVFAHAELLSNPTAQRASNAATAPSSVPAPRCTVVYRCVTEVEGQPLEDWDVEAPALRRWHGKPFQQRHCLGFTVDGRTVTVLMQDVSGVLHTVRSQNPTSPLKSALHDGAALLRECGVPSCATFQEWWPPSPSRSAASPSSMLSMESPAAEKADALKSFARNGRHASLWRTPFALFSLLGAVLRYNRTDAAVYPRLLTRPPAAPFAAGGAWWGRLCALLPFGGGGGGGGGHGGSRERRALLSAPFLILVRAVDGSAAPSAEVLREVQTCTARWVRNVALLAPKHEVALTEVHREAGGQWGLRVDLTRVQTSVLEAGWVLMNVVRLLATVGVPLASARLVAVPEDPSAASLLYPTPDTESLAHYWRPQKPAAPAPPSVTVSAKLPATSSTPSSASASASSSSAAAAVAHPGWMRVELRAGKRMGFVVAHHDFAAL